MKAFRITGKFDMGRTNTAFTMEAVAKDAAAAREYILSTIGSRHRAQRLHIHIADVKEIPADQLTDISVKHALALSQKK